jgi:hypothetical protein
LPTRWEFANGIHYGNTPKKLPLHPHQFATLEIEINLQQEETGTQKATALVAFCIPADRL